MGSAPNSVFKNASPPFLADDAKRPLSYEAIRLLGDEAIRLYGHMAENTESHS